MQLVTLTDWANRGYSIRKCTFDKKKVQIVQLNKLSNPTFLGGFTQSYGDLSPSVAVIYTRITCKVRKFTQLGLKIRVTQRRKRLKTFKPSCKAFRVIFLTFIIRIPFFLSFFNTSDLFHYKSYIGLDLLKGIIEREPCQKNWLFSLKNLKNPFLKLVWDLLHYTLPTEKKSDIPHLEL